MAEIHIAFAGNVAVGKTEFSQQVLREPNRSLLMSFLKSGGGIQSFREISERRLLNRFKDEPSRWAFATQVKYFAQRMAINERIQQFSGLAVEDRTIYEDKNVFVKTHHETGNIHDVEYFVCDSLYSEIIKKLVPPTLLVYLKVNDVQVLKRRVEKRGHEEDKDLSLEYLKQLNKNYDSFFDAYPFPKIAINAETDMFEHPSYHTTVVCEIAQKLKKIGVLQKTDVVPETQEMLDNGIKFRY